MKVALRERNFNVMLTKAIPNLKKDGTTNISPAINWIGYPYT